MLKNKLYVYGDDHHKTIPAHVNIAKYLLQQFLSFESHYAIVDPKVDERMTFKELAQNMVNVSISLTNIGVKRGDVVGICCDNRMEFWPIVTGTLAAGATFTSIPYDVSKAVFQHRIKLARPRILFCAPNAYKIHEETIEEVTSIEKIIVFDEIIENTLTYEDFLVENVNIDDFVPTPVNGFEDIALISYSSGTTGLIKGIMMTHYNILTSLIDTKIVKLIGLKMLLNASWHYSFGFSNVIYSLSTGMTIVFLMDDPNMEVCLEIIQKYKIAMFPLLGTQIRDLMSVADLSKYDLSSLLLISTTSSSCDGLLLEEIRKRIPSLCYAYQVYGMTEIAIVLSPFYATDYDTRSVGGVHSMCVAKVVDLETRKPLGPNQRGELCFTSPSLMKGYVGSTIKYLDEEGFMLSGDIGYYDEKKNFYVVDRVKDTFKFDGFSVIPAELEVLLCQHPKVLEAGVVGAPKGFDNEIPTAFVVKKEECTEEELMEYMNSQTTRRTRLAGGIHFVDSLPRGILNKLDRKELRAMVTKINNI